MKKSKEKNFSCKGKAQWMLVKYVNTGKIELGAMHQDNKKEGPKPSQKFVTLSFLSEAHWAWW